QARNGLAWWRSSGAIQVQLAGDASEQAYSALLPSAELGQEVMRVPFNEEELARMAAGTLGSTERELRAALHALHWLQDRAPELIRNKTIQYQTDSQSAWMCLLGQKGANNCLYLVRDILVDSAQAGCEISLVWYPRTGTVQREADRIGKETDPAQWALNHDIYRRIMTGPCLQ
ncbi:hypothetical protein Vretimale_10866, partial [Volvox reticuliferus]